MNTIHIKSQLLYLPFSVCSSTKSTRSVRLSERPTVGTFRNASATRAFAMMSCTEFNLIPPYPLVAAGSSELVSSLASVSSASVSYKTIRKGIYDTCT